jgi:hypothetical protein
MKKKGSRAWKKGKGMTWQKEKKGGSHNHRFDLIKTMTECYQNYYAHGLIRCR